MRKLIFLFLFISQLTFSQRLVKDTLVVGYTQAPPFIIENNDRLSGINIWLWERVAKDLNLEYKLVKMDFTDMLKALENEKIDASINPLTITSDRSKKMEFTHSFYASNSTIVVQKTTSLNRFLEFLKSFFSINFLRGMLFLIAIIFLFGLMIWLFEKHKNSTHFRKGWKGLFDGMWWSVVTMTTVGYGDKCPVSRGGKIIALVWMFSGLLFISGLTASVASSLTVKHLSTVADDSNEYKNRPVGSIANSSSTYFLKDNFFNKIEEYQNVNEGLEDLSDNKIDAFLYDEPILKYKLKQNESLDNLRLLPVKFDLQLYAFGLPHRQAELEKIISQKILEITESHEWKIVLNEYGLNQI